MDSILTPLCAPCCHSFGTHFGKNQVFYNVCCYCQFLLICVICKAKYLSFSHDTPFEPACRRGFAGCTTDTAKQRSLILYFLIGSVTDAKRVSRFRRHFFPHFSCHFDFILQGLCWVHNPLKWGEKPVIQLLVLQHGSLGSERKLAALIPLSPREHLTTWLFVAALRCILSLKGWSRVY